MGRTERAPASWIRIGEVSHSRKSLMSDVVPREPLNADKGAGVWWCET